MPVFRSGGKIPPWCELEFFEIVSVPAGQTRRFYRKHAREKLGIVEGACRVDTGCKTIDSGVGAVLDIDGEAFDIRDVQHDVTVVCMGGRWGEEVGGAGVFTVDNVERPANQGDPAAYDRRTDFDSHFHDCDEYWIVVRGECEAVSEGKRYRLKPGDCLATGMGHHHDVPCVIDRVTAVYFETTLEGRKRLGHLWEHTHGKAEPMTDRV